VLQSIKAERVDIRKNVTILVADDNVVNLKVACGILARLGYDAVTAADGVQAVTAVADSMNSARRFGAILMDLHMPGMDGLEATQTIKKRFGHAAPPIIALTADASIEDRERCEAAGMDDYLTKPLQVVELTRALARWTETAVLEPAASALLAYVASPAQAAMDFARLEEFREFDPDLETAREVIEIFMTDTPARLAAIADAHARTDPVLLAEATHALKGSASNVGAQALVALASRIDQLAASGTLAWDMDEVLRHLDESWLVTQTELKAWLASNAKAAISQP
jgi:CheY-like chemotaxis protein/HPt (histidine-containing phosphotransfer) domain-containing protein